MGYYTAVIYISCATLLMLIRLMHDNNQIDKVTKKEFTITFLFVIVAMLAEWWGLFLNGAPEWTRVPHIFAKLMDYIATPIIGVRLVGTVLPHSNLQKYLRYLMGFNAVIEVFSAFTGLIYYVDGRNYYHHGPYYILYLLVYSITYLCVFIAYIEYGRKFPKENRKSILTVISLIFIGILVQLVWGGDMRTICLSITYGTILLFIQYLAYALQKNEIDLTEKQMLLETDVMTGLKSRFAYSKTLDMYEDTKDIPEDFVAFVFDVNGLKNINDSLGHKAGDELVQGVGACLRKAFSHYGECFHISGDEFVALVNMVPEDCELVVSDFNNILGGWKGIYVKKMSVSVGYASAKDHPECSVHQLISLADKMMYDNKRRYHKKMKTISDAEQSINN